MPPRLMILRRHCLATICFICDANSAKHTAAADASHARHAVMPLRLFCCYAADFIFICRYDADYATPCCLPLSLSVSERFRRHMPAPRHSITRCHYMPPLFRLLHAPYDKISSRVTHACIDAAPADFVSLSLPPLHFERRLPFRDY